MRMTSEATQHTTSVPPAMRERFSFPIDTFISKRMAEAVKAVKRMKANSGHQFAIEHTSIGVSPRVAASSGNEIFGEKVERYNSYTE